MALRNLFLLVTVVTIVSGCQTWQADKLPPPAAVPQVSETGVVEARYWDNLGSGGVSSVTSLETYPDNPDEVVELNELRSPQNRADAYGSLVRGYIIPPADGSYRFFVAGDGETQFWLSTDMTPENIQMLSLVPGSTGPDQYTKYSSQASGSIELMAENRYYFEIRHKELTGNDHFSVAWEGPDFSRQVVGADAIASLGQSPGQGGVVTEEDVQVAYSLGYRIGFFDSAHGLSFDSRYPPLDQDQDGLYDNWETSHGLDPNDPADARSDADGDILNALDEFWLGTDPNNRDTDGDGIPDGVEFANRLDPLNPEDGNAALDGDVTLSWTAPVARLDGSSIARSEIKIYEVLFGHGPDQLDQMITVDGTATETIVRGLAPGTWYFAIRVIDSNGIVSQLTGAIQHQVN